MEEMSKMKAIKVYFGTPERPVTFEELKALSTEEREELARGAAKELGVNLTVLKQKEATP